MITRAKFCIECAERDRRNGRPEFFWWIANTTRRQWPGLFEALKNQHPDRIFRVIITTSRVIASDQMPWVKAPRPGRGWRRVRP